MNRTYL